MGKTIWLIDATTYVKNIDNELLLLKKEYLKIKAYVRNSIIGRNEYPTKQTYSMGLLRIATILKYLDYEIEYIHFFDFVKTYKDRICDVNPDIISFSCICSTIPTCNEIARNIKEINNSIKTAVGGSHLNVAYELTKKTYNEFDKYIKGYDVAAVELLVEKNVGLLEAPYVDYSILPYPINQYDINIFSTLGCPFNCDYCQDSRLPYYENTIDGGLMSLKEILPEGKLVHFFDSTLGYSMDRLLKVCESLYKLNHNFILSCDLRAEFINKETIFALVKAGFHEIRFGLDNADPFVLKKNNRNLFPEEISNKLKLLREYSNLYLSVYTISGLPGSTVETFNMTEELYRYLLEEKKIDQIKNAQYVPYPIDNIDIEQKGIYIKNHNWEDYDRQSYPVYETPELSRTQIWQAFMNITKTINKSWLKGYGFEKVEDIEPLIIYSDYINRSYIEHEGI